MASAPKRRRVKEVLRRRAEAHHGAGAEPIEAVYDWVRDSGTIATLAANLATVLNESVSASWLKFVVMRLAPNAKQEIAALTFRVAHLSALRRAAAARAHQNHSIVVQDSQVGSEQKRRWA